MVSLNLGKWVYTINLGTWIYTRVGIKGSLADQDTLTECEQMSFIIQHSPSSGLLTSSISVAILGSYWSKKSSTVDMVSAHSHIQCIYSITHK